MFKVKWDKEINGVILCQSSEESLNVSPRPVYKEELDILGFDKYWNYPKKTDSPLLWALGRRYFYKGVCVAEARGGNIFEAPEIVIKEEGKGLKLKPINIKKVIEKNKDALFVLENEAIDFVLNTYKKYKDKVDYVAVAFSGGKDSQVVLDIVSRVLHPDDYIVVFSDTTMELPPTYETVERTKKEYQERYPGLKFYTVKPPKPAIEFWEDFGPPSRIHRWCCTVTKTAPFVNFIRELHYGNGGTKPPRILVFDGVRAEESTARSGYSRVALGVKHLTIINSRPALDWNSTEVYLYLFSKEINLNELYIFGANRVGCALCPFSSLWSDFLVKKIYYDISDKYLRIIKKMLINDRLNNIEEHEFLTKGGWKERAGGNIINMQNKISFINKGSVFRAEIESDYNSKYFEELLKVISNDLFFIKKKNSLWGELKLENSVVKFKKNKKGSKLFIEIFSVDSVTLQKLKKILLKTAYCKRCGACIAECKTGAFNFIKDNLIIEKKCNHCLNCIDFTTKGCLIAKSIFSEQGENKMKNNIGIDKYSTFGLRENWLFSFLNEGINWLISNNLGPKQVPAIKNWLVESELIRKTGKTSVDLTDFFHTIQKIKITKVIWQLIWVNLSYNSNIVNWYLKNLEWNRYYKREELLEILKLSYKNLKSSTLENPLDALLDTFDKSPLGNLLEIGLLKKNGQSREGVFKKNLEDLDYKVVAFSLYKVFEKTGRDSFLLSEFYGENLKIGPYFEFGLSSERFKSLLIKLSELYDIVRVEFNRDLENIFLKDNFDSIKVLHFLIEKEL